MKLKKPSNSIYSNQHFIIHRDEMFFYFLNQINDGFISFDDERPRCTNKSLSFWKSLLNYSHKKGGKRK